MKSNKYLQQPSARERFQNELLEWFDSQQRELPWRREKNGYHTWVSEIMLQQTQVATVIPYFNNWMNKFPDVVTLAKATEEDILNAWEGLGYYRRARHLHESAKSIVHERGGVLPTTAKEWLKLKGIGPYTAGAIASIAYGEKVSAVDGNVIRVIARLKALPGIQPKDASTPKKIASLVEPLISETRPGDFNQALMELGATTCKPSTPLCHSCPVTHFCQAFQLDKTEAFPEKGKKTASRKANAQLAVITKKVGDNLLFLIEQRPEEALLGGTWQFPMEDHVENSKNFISIIQKRGLFLRETPPHALFTQKLQDSSSSHPNNLSSHSNKENNYQGKFSFNSNKASEEPQRNKIGEVQHTFSHIKMTISIGCYTLASEKIPSSFQWVTLQEFKELPVSRAIRKVELLIEKYLS